MLARTFAVTVETCVSRWIKRALAPLPVHHVIRSRRIYEEGIDLPRHHHRGIIYRPFSTPETKTSRDKFTRHKLMEVLHFHPSCIVVETRQCELNLLVHFRSLSTRNVPRVSPRLLDAPLDSIVRDTTCLQLRDKCMIPMPRISTPVFVIQCNDSISVKVVKNIGSRRRKLIGGISRQCLRQCEGSNGDQLPRSG